MKTKFPEAVIRVHPDSPSGLLGRACRKLRDVGSVKEVDKLKAKVAKADSLVEAIEMFITVEWIK